MTAIPRSEAYALACLVVCLLSIHPVVSMAADDSGKPSLAAELKQFDLRELTEESFQLGDANRGKSIFHREKLGCVKCHVASPEDIASGLRPIGPDQRTVGDRLGPEQIVESVLLPNKVIAKGYESFAVVTADGNVIKGVLISQDQQEVVLADSEKKGLIRIARDDVEAMQKANSAMPNELVDQLASRQEFYDLIKYLSEQKASTTGTAVVATGKVLVREVPQADGQLPLLAVARA